MIGPEIITAMFWLYMVNAVLLILHEIDSAYWKEWELFKMRGMGTIQNARRNNRLLNNAYTNAFCHNFWFNYNREMASSGNSIFIYIKCWRIICIHNTYNIHKKRKRRVYNKNFNHYSGCYFAGFHSTSNSNDSSSNLPVEHLGRLQKHLE